MDREQVIDLQHCGLEAFYRVIGGAAESSRVLEFPGVIAAVTPACPNRSFPNSAIYRSAEDLAAALDPLEAKYRHAGIEAWTVWVPEGDEAATRLLPEAGHLLYAAPTAMAIDLADLPDPGPDAEDLDWDADATPEEVGRLNDLAYGWGDDGFGAAFKIINDDSMLLYRARADDGEVACVAATLDVGDDCLLAMVATPPERRGAGLARRLCHLAVASGRDRGLETSSLQASPLGRPIYERMGYAAFGAIEMWERRRGR